MNYFSSDSNILSNFAAYFALFAFIAYSTCITRATNLHPFGINKSFGPYCSVLNFQIAIIENFDFIPIWPDRTSVGYYGVKPVQSIGHHREVMF